MRIRDLCSHVRNLAWGSLGGTFKERPDGFSMSTQCYTHCGFAIFLLILSAKPVLAQTPQINSVQFSGAAGNYTLTLSGTNFGNPAVTLPHTGDVSNFRIGDNTELGHGEWGYTGDANGLTYSSWSNTAIVVSKFGGQPCDSITIALWNEASQAGGTWGGNVPCTV